jgi:hypothetical protein
VPLLPKAPVLPALSVRAPKVTPAVKVLFPVSVSMPVPVLVTPGLKIASLMVACAVEAISTSPTAFNCKLFVPLIVRFAPPARNSRSLELPPLALATELLPPLSVISRVALIDSVCVASRSFRVPAETFELTVKLVLSPLLVLCHGSFLKRKLAS